VAAGLAGLGWFAWRSPRSRFLPPDRDAEWIEYPVPPQITIVADRCPRHTVFRRIFEWSKTSPSIQLQVRTFGHCTIQLNGRPVELPSGDSVHQMQSAEVAGQLQDGSNELRVEVANEGGPPVLWLLLAGSNESMRSDVQWTASLDGAADYPAHICGQPVALRPGNTAWGGNRTMDSLQARLPTLLLFALLSAGVLVSVRLAAARQVSLRLFGYGFSPIGVGLLAASLLWVVLLSHNTLLVPLFPAGFDHEYHLAYVQYILDHRALPLADQGWEMHQPPLFYLLSAACLAVCGLSTHDPGAVAVFRLLGLAAGLTYLATVAACLRLLFADQPRRQLGGLILAAFLPAPLYLCHYITNDWLLMTLGTACLYLALRVVREEPMHARSCLYLGVCLGAALLTKITAFVLAGVILLVLAGKLLAQRERRPSVWLRGVGVTVLATVLVCGWHYARVWIHFGTPLAGNFGTAPSYQWWQDPGHGTTEYLLHFGQSLQAPFFSAFDGLPDGLYSTLWGDGLCGGVGSWANRTPWNYELMAASYLLALIPTLAIGIGLCIAVVQLVRRHRAEWFLLLGVAAGLLVSLLYQFLQYPYYGTANARHLLVGVAPLCAFGALGLDALARLGRPLGFGLVVLLGTWAGTAYMAFWILPQSAVTLNWVGLLQLSKDHPVDARTSFRKAMEADPQAVPPRLNLAGMLVLGRQRDQAQQLIEQVLRDHPDDADAHFGLALFYQVEGRTGEALEHARRASQLAPDNPVIYPILGGILMGQGQTEEAILAYRQSIRVNPSHSAADHANLGLLLARTGRTQDAIAQYWQALCLRPDQPAWQADLAWILVTAEEPRLRDPKLALHLAEEACRLLATRDAVAWQSLAVAQAANGRYPDAARTARQAAAIAADTGQGELVTQIEVQARQYEKGKPAFDRIPPRKQPYPPVSARAVDTTE
jgi:tetratricopeptide (TPR) repeat protein